MVFVLELPDGGKTTVTPGMLDTQYELVADAPENTPKDTLDIAA